MCKKSMKNKEPKKDHFSLVSNLITKLLNAVKQERFSTAGKVNFYTDLVILLFFCVIVVATAFDSFYIFIQNILLIIKDKSAKEINSPNLFVCFIVFVAFVAACLLFMHFITKAKEKINSDDDF